MGKAVQHLLSPGQFCHCKPVVFLIQEKSCFLSIFKVHQITDAVFHYLRTGALRLGQSRHRQPAFAGRQTFQPADRHIAAFINAPYFLPVFPQNPDQRWHQKTFQLLHRSGQHLYYQNI